jgi:hypothetical protein
VYVLELQRKIEGRRERILQALPAKESEGKTIDEVLSDIGNECSVGTLRTDLMVLKERREIECDDKRKPVIWWRLRQK